MGNFGKWIAGGLGWAFFGPIGGIVGFVVGSMLDAQPGIIPAAEAQATRTRRTTTTGGYVMSLLVLVAAVMKADGKVLRSELDYVKQFFVRSFGASSAKEAVRMLGDLLKQNIPLPDVCRQIQKNMDYASRLQLLHFLFGIAQADGKTDSSEINTIELIAKYMGINQRDVDSIKAMFIKNTDAAYKILEVEPTATNDEIKKAYRKMAVKYHPDKVSYLGEDFQKAAKEKFQKVTEAYNDIKKERNLT